MTEGTQIKIAAQLTINPSQDVATESSSHTMRVVVSRFQNARVLLEIGPEQKRIAAAQHFAHRTEKGVRLFRFKVADVRPQKKRECSTARCVTQFFEPVEVLRGVSFDTQTRIGLQQDARAAFKRRDRNIN